MPWCGSCSRFVEDPPHASPEQCPVCDRELSSAEADPVVPWHFKLLVAATAAYLALRAVQGVLWLLTRL